MDTARDYNQRLVTLQSGVLNAVTEYQRNGYLTPREAENILADLGLRPDSSQARRARRRLSRFRDKMRKAIKRYVHSEADQQIIRNRFGL